VQSRKNRGATFWVEFGFRIASSQEIENNKAVDFASLQDDISRPDFDRLGGLLSTARTAQPPSRISSESMAPAPSESGKYWNHDTPRNAAAVPPHMMKSYSAPDKRQNMPYQEEDLIPSEPDRPLRVLVVDDDPLTRTLMTRLLSRLSCEVQTANDGQQFLDLLLGNGTPEGPLMNTPQYFDMVTLDNAMPVCANDMFLPHVSS
jgi:CheY-like chemotaxis protein